MFALAVGADSKASAAIAMIEKHEAVCAERAARREQDAAETKQRMGAIEKKVDVLPEAMKKHIAESPQIAALNSQNVLIIRVMVWGGLTVAAVVGTILWYFLHTFLESVQRLVMSGAHP